MRGRARVRGERARSFLRAGRGLVLVRFLLRAGVFIGGRGRLTVGMLYGILSPTRRHAMLNPMYCYLARLAAHTCANDATLSDADRRGLIRITIEDVMLAILDDTA